MNPRVTAYALALLFLLLSAGGGVAHATPGAVSFKSCKSGAALTLTRLLFEPYLPTISQPLKIIARGSTTVPIAAGATLVHTYKVGSMLVASRTDDLCSLTGKAGLPCTIAAGTHDFVSSITLPDNISPFVDINVRAVVKNADGSVLACFDYVMTFEP